MNEALKTLEAMLVAIRQEVNRIASDSKMTEKSFILLRQANLQLIDVTNTIQDARGWNKPNGE